jgi:uncharacterized membrane protein
MALITSGALLMALRHGAPTAVMGLVGGFLTPALVGDPDSSAVPLLFYLGLLNLALFALAFRRGWTWLAPAAVILSFVWTVPLLFAEGPEDALAAGIFIAVIAAAASVAHPGAGRQLRLVRPAMIGLAQLAVLVARADLDASAWALFGTLSLACLALAVLRPEHRWLPVAALGLALLLLAAETIRPGTALVLTVAAATTILFGAVGAVMALRSRDRLLWTGIACAAVAGPVLILRLGEPQLLGSAVWGAIVAAVSLGPAALAWAHAQRRTGEPGRAVAVAAGTAAAMLMIAITEWVQTRDYAIGWLLIALALGLAARWVRERRLFTLGFVIAACAVLAAIAHTGGLWIKIPLAVLGEVARLAGLPRQIDAVLALLIPAALLMLLWRISERGDRLQPPLAWTALFLGLGGAYVLYKQLFALTSFEDFAARGFADAPC